MKNEIDQVLDEPTLQGPAPQSEERLRRKLEFVQDLIRELGKLPPNGCLAYRDVNDKARVLALSGAVTAGRSSRCDLRLQDPWASQEHFRVQNRSGYWELVDLKSTNGTYLNGVRLPSGESRPLIQGGFIQAGGEAFVFLT